MDIAISILGVILALVVIYRVLDIYSLRADFNRQHAQSGEEILFQLLGNTEKAEAYARELRAYGHRTTLLVTVCAIVLGLLNEFFS